MAVHMLNKQNKTLLSEKCNEYRKDQSSNSTRLRLVLLLLRSLRYSFQFSDNDVLLDNNAP